MKRILLIASVLVAACAVSCTKETKVEDAVTIKSDDATVPVEGGVVSIAINSTVAWTAKASESWVTISPSSGEAGDATVKASVLKNGTNDSRTATVTFTAGTKSATYTITQSQLDAMNIATTEYVVEAEGGTVEIPVSANVDYSVIVPDAVDWIHVTSTKGMVDTKITLKVDPTHEYDVNEEGAPTLNPDAIVRTAKITVAGAGDKEVTIGQKAFVPYFEYGGDWAGLQWSFYDGEPTIIPQEGADITIDIDTNIDWRTYFSVWDNEVGDMVDSWDLGWAQLTYDETHIYLKVAPNDTYFARDNYLYSVGIIDGEENGNWGGLGWFRQPGKPIEGAVAEFVWAKSLTELGIPANNNRLAYTATGALLVSDGEKVHAVSPADGTYWKAITYPGITPSSICSDDAGNVLVAPDVEAPMDWDAGVLTGGTEFTIYYSADPNKMENSIVVENKDYGTIGGIRVRGDISKKAVITGVAGGASCWFGYDIEAYEPVPNYYGTQNQGPGPGANTFWTPQTAASISLGTSLHDGVLYRGYDGNESLYYLADAYTPNWAVPYSWQLITDAGNGGNENQNNLALVEYKGKRILAYTQGFHFDYSANATIYVLDVTDINNVTPIVTIDPTADIAGLLSDFTYNNSADVLLHPTDECLEVFVVNSGRSVLGKYKIVLE